MNQTFRLFALSTACCLLLLSGCSGTVGADWPSAPIPFKDAGVADQVPDEDTGPADTGSLDAGVPDAGPGDIDTFEIGLTDVADINDNVADTDIPFPDKDTVDVFTGIAGCVSCHTNKELLMELAPPEPPEEEEGGGG